VKQHFVRIAIGLAIVFAFIGHAAKLYQVGIVAQLDNIIYDTRLRVTMPRGIDERIVILDIDEKSLQEVARWPWPRDVMARLITKLFDTYQVSIVGFDVVFAESDYSSGIKRLDELAQKEFRQVPGFNDVYQQLRPQLDNDALFAQSIKGRPVILGYYLSSEKDAKRIATIPDPVLPAGTFAGRNIAFASYLGYGGNLSELVKNAAGSGHFNPLVDADGVVRRVPLIAEFEGAYYEALSLAIVRAVLGFPKVEPGYPADRVMHKGYGGLEWLKVGPLTIPVDDTVSTLIPYRGGKFSYRYISLSADNPARGESPASVAGDTCLTRAYGLIGLEFQDLPILQHARLPLPGTLLNFLHRQFGFARLQMSDVDLGAALELAELFSQHRRTQMLGQLCKVALFVGERGLDDQVLQIGDRVDGLPELIVRSGIAGEYQTRVSAVQVIADCRNSVQSRDRRNATRSENLGLADRQLGKAHERRFRCRYFREVRPDRPVEYMVLQDLDRCRERVNGDRLGAHAADAIDQEGDAGDVVEVRMGEVHVVD